MPAGSIVIDLMMRTGSFETDTARAEKRLAELKKEAAAVGTAIGASFAGVAIASAALVKSAIDAMDALSDVAQISGTTTESLSALAYAAEFGAVSQETLSASLVRLSKTMAEATDGSSDAAAAFKALGVSVQNTDGSLRASDQVLLDLADKFAGYRDGAEKTALAVKIFGKSGAELIPLLNRGAAGIAELTEEAAKLGIVISTDAANAAGDFNDNLDRLAATVTGLSNRAAQELLPSLVAVSEQLVALAKDSTVVEVAVAVIKGAIGGLLTVFQTITVVASDVGFVFLGVGREIAAWAAQIAAVARGDLKGFTAISDAVKEDGERARAELDKFKARVMSLGQPGYTDPRILGNPGSIAEQTLANNGRAAPIVSGGGGKDKKSEYEKYLESLQRQLDRVKDLTAAEQVLADIEAKRIGTLSTAQRDRLLAVAKEIDAVKQLQEDEKSRTDSAKALAAAQKQIADEVKGLYDSTRTPLEQYAAKQERLNELLDAGRIDADLYTRAMTQAGEALTAATTKGADGLDKMSEASKRAEQNIQDALGDTLEDALSGNFDNIGKAWIALLNKMVSQALAADLLDKLMGRGSGTSNQDALWKGFSSIFSAFSGTTNTGFGTGSTYGNQDYGAFLATGTNYVPYDNFPAILHEGEAVVPKKYNPAAGGRAPGGGFDFSNATYNIGAGVSRGEVEAAVRAGNVQLMGQIQRSERQRYGA